MVHSEGKNWERVLERLHAEQHILTHISEPSKLREHYNRFTRKDSPLKKEYLTPPLNLPERTRRRMEREGQHTEIKQLEQEHSARHQRERDEREKARALILEIEERERSFSTDEKGSISKIREKIKAGEEARKKARHDRTDALLEAARAETDQKVAITDNMQMITKVLAAVSESTVAIANSLSPRPSQPPNDSDLWQGMMRQQQEMLNVILHLQDEVHALRDRKRKRPLGEEKEKEEKGTVKEEDPIWGIPDAIAASDAIYAKELQTKETTEPGL